MERPILPAGPVRPAAEAGLATLDVVARTRVASAAAAALASNTRATYASQWNRFRSWCERRGTADPLDADAAVVAAYLAERAETRKLSTVQASAAAIAAAARAGRADPTKTPLSRDTLRGTSTPRRPRRCRAKPPRSTTPAAWACGCSPARARRRLAPVWQRARAELAKHTRKPDQEWVRMLRLMETHPAGYGMGCWERSSGIPAARRMRRPG